MKTRTGSSLSQLSTVLLPFPASADKLLLLCSLPTLWTSWEKKNIPMKLGLGIPWKALRTRTTGDGPRDSLSFSSLKWPRGNSRVYLFPVSLTSHLAAMCSSPPQESSVGLPGCNPLGMSRISRWRNGSPTRTYTMPCRTPPFFQKNKCFTSETKLQR